MKKSFLAILLITLSLSANSHAFDFGKIIEKAKENAAAANDNGLQKIEDSKYVFSRDTSAGARWVMITISKDGKSEQLVLDVKNAKISANIYLRSGKGIYTIAAYENSTNQKYGNSYYPINSIQVENTDKRNMSFLLPSEMVQSDSFEIISLAKKITDGAVDELDAITKIHTYVANTIKYDYDSYKDGSYVSKTYDALITLKNKKAVCAGYSNLYAALARASGIRTKVIYGLGYTDKAQGENHAWNEVFINNEWKSVDVTWDSTTKIMFKYFMIPNEVFEKDHQKQTVQNF